MAFLPVLAPRLKDETGSLSELRARYAHVKKNAKGGIHMSEAAVLQCVDLLGKGKARVTTSGLERIKAFFPTVSHDELTTLLGGGKALPLDDLKFLLLDNAVAHYDPIKEAFRAYCDDHGRFDLTRFRAMHESLGMPVPSNQDIATMFEAAGVTGTTGFTLDHFRRMCEYADSRAMTPGERLYQAPSEDDLDDRGGGGF